MARYYFDLRDGNEVAVDEEGIELRDLEAVQLEAARSLVEMVEQAAWTRTEAIVGNRLAIEVRDGSGPLLAALFTFVERSKH